MAQRNGLEMLLAARRSRAELCVSFGHSPLGALVMTNRGNSYAEVASKFLLAFSCTSTDNLRGWMSSRGLMAMAHHVL